MNKKLLLIELNEFNTDLLRLAVKQMKLPHIAKVLSFTATQTSTDDVTDSGFLEPWVQWVSIHTGIPSSEHQIKHLGDVPRLNQKQVWESLGQQRVSSGIWGVMNGGRRNVPAVRFFLPDPWTFSEQGFPSELNNLLDLPRYLSKNYLALSKGRIAKDSARLLWFLARSGKAWEILKEFLYLIFSLARYGPKHFVFISFFDYLSTLLFVTYKRAYDPSFSLIFLNSIAHLQHHHWTKGPDALTPPLRFGFTYIDRALGKLLASRREGEAVLVLNGLSQMNTNHEKPWILFRQIDPAMFLKTVGIRFERIEQLMTKDAHVFFKDESDAASARDMLARATVNGQPAFYVESDSQNPRKLFYRLEYTDAADRGTVLMIGSKSWTFFDLFEPVVVRTGRHIPVGVAFGDGVALPPKIKNHEIARYITAYFGVTSSFSAV